MSLYMSVICMSVCVCMSICGSKRSGRPLCDKACSKTRGLATKPPCDKPIEDCGTLHRGPQQGFATEGRRQGFVTEGGGP